MMLYELGIKIFRWISKDLNISQALPTDNDIDFQGLSDIDVF